MNKNKAAAIIDGPEDVLNSKEENNPNITDNNPPILSRQPFSVDYQKYF